MTEAVDDVDRRLAASRLRLRARAPFFGTLTLFAEYIADPGCETFATDGRRILYAPAFAASLEPTELDAVLLHEVLHAALLHPSRRGARKPEVWNAAADIVVNGIVAAQPGVRLPRGALREPRLESLRVEEVYALLIEREEPPRCPLDLLDSTEACGTVMESASVATLRAHWRAALQQAAMLDPNQGGRWGKRSAALAREVDAVLGAALPWETLLWRHVVRSPDDYEGFDRRLIHRGLYLEALDAQALAVKICVDTSGSIDDARLGRFLFEIEALTRAYPMLEAELFYADAALHGPFPLARDTRPAPPVGGGGTSFVPFFERLRSHPPRADAVAVYLTDGEGRFPQTSPPVPVVWVVVPGGADESHFPFGVVVRMID